jgi:hypothetical protein
MEKKKKTTANIGFEKKLWQAADKLRGSMDAADYKHVVLGLIFLTVSLVVSVIFYSPSFKINLVCALPTPKNTPVVSYC